MSKLPIIFCHYGNTHYLRYTIKCARLTNPDTRIILLGDDKNQWLSKYVEHYPFSDYENGALLKEFESVYRVVAGPKSPLRKEGDLKRDWINFVFRRWYIVYEFCKSENIDTFWHFDSDNIILDDLSKHLYKFQDYDCTEKCNGICLNGYIGSQIIVKGYLQKINEIFRDRNDYLDMLQEDFNTKNLTYAFTEMRSYDIFRKEEGINSIRMNKIINNETFDDIIAEEHGMIMEEYAPGKKMKKITILEDGLYSFKKQTGEKIRIIAMDLSWLPFYLFETSYLYLKSSNKKKYYHQELKDIIGLVRRRYSVVNQIKNFIERIHNKAQNS